MIQFIALAAALFGGGYFAKKALDKRHHAVANASAITSTPVDEFLELRSDGLVQFNRQTAISILGWLGSVSLVPVATDEKLDAAGLAPAQVFDLSTNADGSPPALGTGAAKRLLELAKGGKTVLVSRDVTIAGRPERRAVATIDAAKMRMLASKTGKLAILIVPAEEHVEPTLPPLEGFEGVAHQGVPGVEMIAVEDKGSVDLPNDLRRQIDDLLKKENADDKTLEAVARQLRLGGYEHEADLVDARRADVRVKEVVNEPQKFFIIPEGHPGAIALAKKLVGDGKRVGEIASSNPALGVAADGSVVPWSPGQIVRLPSSWVS